MKSNRPLYEGLFLLAPNLSDESRLHLFEKIRSGLTSREGSIEKEHDMGRRKLAYKIQKHSEGYYMLVYFTLAAESMKEFWVDLKLMQESGLLRYMIVQANAIMEKLEFKQLAHS